MKPVWAWAGIWGMLTVVMNTGPVMKRFQATRFFQWSKRNGFGIYLFHPMLIYLAFFWLGRRQVNPWLFSGVVIAGSYFLSGLAT